MLDVQTIADEIHAHVLNQHPLPTQESLAVLQLLAEGNSQVEAAAKLFISLSTAKFRIRQAGLRLGGKTATHTTVLAVQRRLIPGVRA